MWFRRVIREGFAGETPLRAQRYVVVDTELTSLERKTNRVLSIGAIAMHGTRIVLGEQFYRVLNPEAEIPAETVKIHGLRPADVRGGEPAATAIAEFSTFTRGAVLVGHFVEIDMAALSKDGEFDNPVVDTARVHRWLVRRRYSEDIDRRLAEVDLATLARHYKLAVQELHHALGDAFLTAQLWQKLMVDLEKEGVGTLGKVLRLR